MGKQQTEPAGLANFSSLITNNDATPTSKKQRISSMLLPQISAESVNSSNIKLPFPKYHINMEDDGYYSAFSADDDDDDLTDQEMQSQSNKYRKRSHSHRYSRRIEVNEESKQ